jgi:hypothetical protein
LLKRQGDVEDHAILLCSLLLGWGLDAWVAYGTIHPSSADSPSSSGNNSGSSSSGSPMDRAHQHYWVVTLDALRFDEGDAKSDDSFVTFWGEAACMRACVCRE